MHSSTYILEYPDIMAIECDCDDEWLFRMFHFNCTKNNDQISLLSFERYQHTLLDLRSELRNVSDGEINKFLDFNPNVSNNQDIKTCYQSMSKYQL